jgi:hypothetical protein
MWFRQGWGSTRAKSSGTRANFRQQPPAQGRALHRETYQPPVPTEDYEVAEMVYVLDKDGNPLMPTERHGKVRRMLKDDMLKEFSKPVRADRLKPIRNGRGLRAV